MGPFAFAFAPYTVYGFAYVGAGTHARPFQDGLELLREMPRSWLPSRHLKDAAPVLTPACCKATKEDESLWASSIPEQIHVLLDNAILILCSRKCRSAVVGSQAVRNRQ